MMLAKVHEVMHLLSASVQTRQHGAETQMSSLLR